MWEPLFSRAGVSIDFAHRTFRWDSESNAKAHVHCVIVGFSCEENSRAKSAKTAKKEMDESSRTSRTSREVFSPAARAVFDAGRELWRHYHAQPNALPDASLYDIRAHFQGFKPNGHMNPDSADEGYSERIATLRSTLKALAAQIAPKVFEHGFLRG
jgi:hypothetical protein